MELNIENMSLNDCIVIKSILEERLKKKEIWMNSERGYNYEEYCRRELIYFQDENHEKLKQINKKIKNIRYYGT